MLIRRLHARSAANHETRAICSAVHGDAPESTSFASGAGNEAGLKKNHVSLGIVVPVVALAAAACSSASGHPALPPPGSQAPTGTGIKQYADPFAYCAAVGTVDSPASPYVGGKIPDQIIAGYKLAAGLETSTEPLDLLRQTTVWRCMEGKVYACNFGANLPCDSKADTNSEPTSGMTSYCQSNPDAGNIPMSVTGHATIFSWHCVGEQAATQSQIDQADAEGYLKRIWYQIPPP